MRDTIFKHKGAILGGLIGLTMAILILTIGLWKALLLIFLIALGVLVGMIIDGNSVIRNSINKFKK